MATPADSVAILNIYAPYVQDTAVSFETEVPPLEEFTARIERISAKYPYLVYEADGKVVGYAYASRHRERAAYCYDVDLSIYFAPEHHGTGKAARLYGALFALLAELGYCNTYAAYTEPNEKSRRFHEKCGFSPVGTFHHTGYKFGRWHDVTWVEKALKTPEQRPALLKSIRELPAKRVGELLRPF